MTWGVPSEDWNMSFQWCKPCGGLWIFLSGGDWYTVEGSCRCIDEEALARVRAYEED